MREISVDFVYSLKKKRRFNSHAEGTVNVIIVCCEDNYGRPALKKVTMITSTHKLSLSSLLKKSSSFSVVKNK